MKLVYITFFLFLTGCASSNQEPQVIVKENGAKDVYIDKLESVASDAAAGVKAVREVTAKDSITYAILENQELRLTGIKPPSVAKLDEYRATIANKDTKMAEKDKVEASKVDEETSELYATVAALDSQLAEEKLRRAESDRVAERALKEQFRTSLQNKGMYLAIAGILVVAFLKDFIKSGIVMCLGGIVLVLLAYFAESPAVHWVLGATFTLVALEILWLTYKYWKQHFGKKDLQKEING